MNERKIFITEQDAERLRNLLRGGAEKNGDGADHLKRLAEELLKAEIVDPKKIPGDVVTMNSEVKFRDLETGEAYTYSIVYPGFADFEKNRISVLAPIGMALLGCRVGNVLEWPVPAGLRRLQIEDILYQPEAAGQYDM
jgi:regulator of nucleoside diphosphate kinase